ncbi:hypothetical protein AB4Y96_21445 [Phyllobacterium sp. TAF24]|uniref:hypothetical protein n=1 Tax=Phyllobacterium sp. TAF24 TaxID=3233068 RepID=UPI003F9C0A28
MSSLTQCVIVRGPVHNNPAEGLNDGVQRTVSEENIFLVSTDDTPTIVRVNNNPNTEDGAPAMTPDGRWIYFESHKGDDDTPTQIWRIATPKIP